MFTDAVFYKFVGIRGICTYCGDLADSIDHVPPVSAVELGIGLREGEYFKTPACFDCNSRLGACPLLTVPERRQVLAARLRQRFRKLLAAQPWTDEDLLEVVEQQQARISDLRSLVANLEDQIRDLKADADARQETTEEFVETLPHTLPTCSALYPANPWNCAACAAMKELHS